MAADPRRPELDVIPPPAVADDRYAALNDASAGDGEWIVFASAGSRQAAPADYSAPGGDRDAVLRADGSLLVRRSLFESVGGFAEGVVAGAERELCLRLGEVGATVEIEDEKPPAGAIARWLHRRGAPVSGRSPGVWARLAADNRILSRRRLPDRGGAGAVVILTDAYPARSETFIANEIAALRRSGRRVRVESSARPTRIDREAARAGRVDYLEDDPPVRALLDLIRLAARHPIRVLGDLVARRRWRKEERVWPLRSLASAARRLEAGGERHLHAHFAAGAALHAMRLARLAGIPWSVTGHGYDVFAKPRNLTEKLVEARFVVAPCEYTADRLRAQMPPADRGCVHVVVMGVDGDGFRRSRPYPGGRTVVAIGRLVEKKGFGHLIEASGMLEGRAPVDRLLIAGDGPLRRELESAIERTGLHDRATIVDAWGRDAIRELLEGIDLLAMPSVIAADGDRDAMPVVVKEAMAMEIPVVASDEVGLPELVRPQWGRLVRPADPGALAAAIEEVLALPVEARVAMGRAGRVHVLEHCDVDTETAKLAALIDAAEKGAAGRR